ncbi:MAG: DUF1028 domain-containing protein [Promethearchaeota archaeon]
MTFSICGFDPNTGDLGVAVQSKFICVGMVVPFVKANVGAIATQAFCNTTFGPRGLELLAKGNSPQKTLNILLKDDPEREQRQVGIINVKGEAAAFTGKECFYWAGHIVGENFTAQGNILVNSETIELMAKAFESTKGDLSERLLSALEAVDKPGYGDVRGQQSAALLVHRENAGYGGFSDDLVNIRVDEHPKPIKELRRIFSIYDMIFLKREDPSNLLPIQDEIAVNIRKILVELNYLPRTINIESPDWTKNDHQALENWIEINNFENKFSKKYEIWKSIYDYILSEKGTPAVNLRKMSEIQ